MQLPNIVCVSVDSLRADESFADPNAQTMPFLSGLSDNGTVFEQAITAATWTLPSHTSIFTGLYPPEHGVASEGTALGDHPTFAELLSENGYTTRAAYWNGWLDTADILRGFSDRWQAGADAADNTATVDESDSLSVHERLDNVLSQLGERALLAEDGIRSAYRAIELFDQWRGNTHLIPTADRGGQATVDHVRSSLNVTESPVCWFVHLDTAHWPYYPPAPYHQLFTDRSLTGLLRNGAVHQRRAYGTRADRHRTRVGLWQIPDREATTFRNLYRGDITYTDALIKQLVTAFKQGGQWEDTVFILFGDHGDSFGKPDGGTFGHHSVDDSAIRVPLLIRDPTGQIEPGRVTNPTSLIDLYPTIAAIAGIDAPETHGIDLTTDRRERAYTYDHRSFDRHERAAQFDVPVDRVAEPVRYSVWESPEQKAVWNPESDTWHGPAAGDKRLRNALRDTTAALAPIETTTERVDDRIRSQLEQMGYL